MISKDGEDVLAEVREAPQVTRRGMVEEEMLDSAHALAQAEEDALCASGKKPAALAAAKPPGALRGP